jgi:hypothetical protein
MGFFGTTEVVPFRTVRSKVVPFAQCGLKSCPFAQWCSGSGGPVTVFRRSLEMREHPRVRDLVGPSADVDVRGTSGLQPHGRRPVRGDPVWRPALLSGHYKIMRLR